MVAVSETYWVITTRRKFQKYIADLSHFEYIDGKLSYEKYHIGELTEFIGDALKWNEFEKDQGDIDRFVNQYINEYCTDTLTPEDFEIRHIKCSYEEVG